MSDAMENAPKYRHTTYLRNGPCSLCIYDHFNACEYMGINEIAFRVID